MSGGHKDQAFIRAATLSRANTSWMDKAICWSDKDSDPWSPEPPSHEGRPRKSERLRYQSDVEMAISICQQCPVMAQCLADAESRNEQYGIWGGRDFYKIRPHSKKVV